MRDTMKRREDWPERLVGQINLVRDAKFAWGYFDCCLFPANCVLAMTDVDIAAPLRGYSDALGAMRALKQFGGGKLDAAMDKIARDNGMEEVTPKFMSRGDIGIVNAEDFGADPAFGGMLTINAGHVIAIAVEEGFIFTEMAAVRRAWRVPF